MPKPSEQVSLVSAWLVFWLLIVVVAVAGYDLLIAHVFGGPVVDLEGGAGVYLLLQAVLLPVIIPRLAPEKGKAR